jgi:hydrogenase maturation protein HypF
MGALLIRVYGVVQGVGFRPFVYRLAHENGLAGWVLNQQHGVEIHAEGSKSALESFVHELEYNAPSAADIRHLEVSDTEAAGVTGFVIHESESGAPPSVDISPDLPVCGECLSELFDPANPRYLYPYINCTNCGPRFTVIEKLPYDRKRTTMRHWPMDELCASQYHDPFDRRFHAQPVACTSCGPHYFLETGTCSIGGDHAAIETAARDLRNGLVVAIKGIGGYHLSCDARNASAVYALRDRKFRKEKPFAVMVRDLPAARAIVNLSPEEEILLRSSARPIVLAAGKVGLPGVAPGNHELGVMLPYTPLHHLIFAAGAPEILVMTSGNRSSEPIAYRDEEARQRLSGLADVFLMGERPIARRVDDSVVRSGVLGPVILRRSRGYAPASVTSLPVDEPILAVGADLKNTITLVVGGQAFVSQHIGDLDHYEALTAFKETIRDLLGMYCVRSDDLTVVHDAHPQYLSTLHALEIPAKRCHAVQHHRAHIASVMAEKQAWERRAVGFAFDGTGYGDDATIWGGEFFVGSLAEGWTRACHLKAAVLPGGDAAARFPVQCAAGFLEALEDVPDLLASPFLFPERYLYAKKLVRSGLRTFVTSSIGRLFDAVAALLGFTGEVTFEGQAAIWLEQLATPLPAPESKYPFPVTENTLDYAPLLSAVLVDRQLGRERAEIARKFHHSIAWGVLTVVEELCHTNSIDLAILSGGVLQNRVLLSDIVDLLRHTGIELWTNCSVPPNDGGISLGQAASSVFEHQRTGPLASCEGYE